MRLDDPQTRESLSRSVDARRGELSEALGTLRRAVATPVDLRASVAARPWAFVAAGFLFGFWLGVRV